MFVGAVAAAFCSFMPSGKPQFRQSRAIGGRPLSGILDPHRLVIVAPGGVADPRGHDASFGAVALAEFRARTAPRAGFLVAVARPVHTPAILAAEAFHAHMFSERERG